MQTTIETPRRARTPEQKSSRRKAILEAADQHLRNAGFEAFSMGELARQANVAKGTLYLYFKTREEVLLSLYMLRLSSWSEALAQAIYQGMSDEAFAQAYFDTMRSDPTFLILLSRLDSVIEHNVCTDKLVESKRLMLQVFDRLTPVLERVLNLPAGHAFEVIVTLGAFLLGVTQADAGPSLNAQELPEDVRQLVAAFGSEALFVPNACHILKGIRGLGRC